MAGTRFTVSANVAFSTSRKTLLAITAPANQTVIVNLVSVSFDGTDPEGAKHEVEIRKAGDLGGTSAGAITAVKLDAGGQGTVQTTCGHNYNGTAGTDGSVAAREYVHPQAGFTFREKIEVLGGTTLSLMVDGGGSGNAMVRMNCEE